MSKEHEGMPFVPEEDLNLHEDFQPIIAENGIIRQPPSKVPAADDFTTLADATFTRMDTVQDLVQLRQAEAKENSKASTNPAEEENKLNASLPHGGEKSPVRGDEGGEQPKAVAPVEQPAPVEAPQSVVAPKPAPKSKPDKKQKLAAKKAAKSGAQVPPKTPSKKPVAQQPAPTPKNTPQKPRRWPWVLAILCFLFLGGLTGMVPVEKIPLLRNIAYAMGFTKDDTARMSFLRALLTWTDKHFALPGFLRQDEESRAALWARIRGENTPDESDLAGLQARMAYAGGKTSLIDINALNALQRQKGRQLDGIRGSIAPIDGQEKNPSPAELRDGDVNVRTEANRDKGDVYFGADTSAVNRNFQDGYDSVNTLKKLANPHIANGEPIDWLKNMTQRMMRADTGLGGINKELRGTKVNWATDLSDLGEQKPHRDLYHAWITSRMSKYTSNVMLKKSLADTSFLGAEMPDMSTNVLSFAGIQVDTESLQADQREWQEYLEWEKNCKEDLKNSGGKIDAARDDFNALYWDEVKGKGSKAPVNLDFPTDCNTMLSASNKSGAYQKNLATIASACKTMKSGYESLQQTCRMQVDTNNRCRVDIVGNWAGQWESFYNYCSKEYCEAKKKAWEAQPHAEGETWDEAKCQAEVRDSVTEKDFLTEKGFSVKSGEELTTANLILDQVGGDEDYFPQITKDQAYEDDTGNVHNTIINAMGENKTL